MTAEELRQHLRTPAHNIYFTVHAQESTLREVHEVDHEFRSREFHIHEEESK